MNVSNVKVLSKLIIMRGAKIYFRDDRSFKKEYEYETTVNVETFTPTTMWWFSVGICKYKPG